MAAATEVSPLFRPEVVAAARSRLRGDLLLTRPPGAATFTLLVLSALCAAAALLWFGEGRRSERVTGYLAPEAGLLRVRAPQAGRVAEVFVAEGASVEPGDPLVAIRDPRTGTGAGQAGQDALVAIDTALGRIESLRGAAEVRHRQESERLAAALDRARARGLRLSEQQRLADEALALAERSLERLDALVRRGGVSSQARDLAQRDVLRARGEQASLALALIDLDDRVARLRSQQAELALDAGVRRADLDDRRDRLIRERAELIARVDYLLRAPGAGRVATLAVAAGDSVHAGRSLLTLMPEDGAMDAVLLVPSRAIGFVEPGQKVRLRIDAFPATRFGAQQGEIVSVSETALLPGELEGPVSIAEPVFRVRVRPAADRVRAYGRRYPLRAGMALEADIELERRRLLAWLFEPLLAAWGRL
ncbi:MAG: HlyD family efflux transporter periplasmic adaptor subunit [Pseudomonadales bacterium]|nr:HlyD family efflux transporter periplasmic adaptor subunit [Pseudomonadales bacterium]